MNCSGKHAGMLATTVGQGGDLAAYLDPDHPTQLAILATIDDLAVASRPRNLAVDGCGAPLFAISLYGLARAYGRLAAATEGPEARVAEAIRSHPEYVSGTRRDELAAAPGDPRADRQGRGRGGVRRRPARRPRRRRQDL